MIEIWEKIREKTLNKRYGKELREIIFKNPTTSKEEDFVLFGQKDWSVILPITGEGEVITVVQYKQGCNKIIRELPAGTADFKDEDPEQVAIRELMEETGYKAEKVIALNPPLWIASRSSWTRFYPFLAVGCKKVGRAKYDTSEEIEEELISWDDWYKMAQKEIEEPSALVATFRALPYLENLKIVV